MWKAEIVKEVNGFYTVIVRENSQGCLIVSRGYTGRYFKTEKAALRSVEKHIEKFGMND